MSMYVCRRTPSETDPNGTSVVLELTPQGLDDMCSTFPVVHSEDELLRNLQQGVELRSPMTGIIWFRVAKPLTYVPRPTSCQITNTPLKGVMYDGKTRQGPWAIMSEEGWQRLGCGRIGTGYGQKYLRNEEGDFYLSEGMATPPRALR